MCGGSAAATTSSCTITVKICFLSVASETADHESHGKSRQHRQRRESKHERESNRGWIVRPQNKGHDDTDGSAEERSRPLLECLAQCAADIALRHGNGADDRRKLHRQP